MSIDQHERLLTGRTMGTTWSVRLGSDYDIDVSKLNAAFQGAVQAVDRQMSTWDDASDLMRFNAAPIGEWVQLPNQLIEVLAAGLAISRDTQGAFEMNVGDVVRAWGFCADDISLDAIQAASQSRRTSALDALALDAQNGRAKKTAALALDLSGIAKGYGVDRLATVAMGFGIENALCMIDGEVRALGAQDDGQPWSVGVELPDAPERAAHSMLTLSDMAVATSGDYRHFVDVKGTRLSHTIDPRRGSPKVNAPASVTVLAKSCMHADAMATALMVMGQDEACDFARDREMSALILTRQADGIAAIGTGVFKD